LIGHREGKPCRAARVQVFWPRRKGRPILSGDPLPAFASRKGCRRFQVPLGA
jgi:hypothetical protein